MWEAVIDVLIVVIILASATLVVDGIRHPKPERGDETVQPKKSA